MLLYEHGNEFSGYIKGGEFIDEGSNYRFFKNSHGIVN
jgi:hypothetical protein